MHTTLLQLPSEPVGWSIRREAELDRWTLRRGQESPIEVRGVPWRTPTPIPDSLPDCQKLERVLCGVLSRAYPAGTQLVEGWLEEIRASRATFGNTRQIKWKAAVLLWAALVDESSTSEAGIASRFFGQHVHCTGADFFASFVQPALASASLVEALDWLLCDS